MFLLRVHCYLFGTQVLLINGRVSLLLLPQADTLPMWEALY